ncbi:MAG TPA: hypothetical protein VGY30_02380 [Solirubrobacteraceae bacterium]|nr:hypothetical protein [Solirubrobacteraceae bacterium]
MSTANTTPALRRSPAKRALLKAEAVAAALVVEEAVFLRELVIGSLGSGGVRALGSGLHAEVRAFSGIGRRRK